MIICISGLPGSGKTYTAEKIKSTLAEQNIPFVHLTSDFIADKLLIEKYHDQADRDVDYTSEELDIIYNGLYLIIEKILKANPRTIIITDGMYRKTTQRMMLRMIASSLGTPFTLVKMNTEPVTAKRRLILRNKLGDIGGWVDPKEYEDVTYEPHISISNNSSKVKLYNKIEQLLARVLPAAGYLY